MAAAWGLTSALQVGARSSGRAEPREGLCTCPAVSQQAVPDSHRTTRWPQPEGGDRHLNSGPGAPPRDGKEVARGLEIARL